jgi:predicted porin
MKLVLVACSALAFTNAAHAESSVQLYGVIDAFAQALDADGSVQRVQSGGLAASRFGLRGREDLGGGLEAYFTLEGGLNVDEGTLQQNGALFGRQSFVGLRGPFGALSAGRLQGSIFTTTVEFSSFAAGNAGPSTALIGGFGGGYEPVRGAATSSTAGFGPVRINNALRYETPVFSGLRASVLYGTGETPSAVGRSHLVDLGVRYTKGPFDLIGTVVQDEVKAAGGVFATRATTSALAASYRWGAWRVLGGYLDFNDRRAVGQDGDGAWLGAEYRSGKFTWKAQYVLSSPAFIQDGDSRAFGAGLVYELSKRTALYGSITRFRNDRNAGAGGLGRFNAAVPAQLTSAASNDITELVTGIRHSF